MKYLTFGILILQHYCFGTDTSCTDEICGKSVAQPPSAPSHNLTCTDEICGSLLPPSPPAPSHNLTCTDEICGSIIPPPPLFSPPFTSPYAPVPPPHSSPSTPPPRTQTDIQCVDLRSNYKQQKCCTNSSQSLILSDDTVQYTCDDIEEAFDFHECCDDRYKTVSVTRQADREPVYKWTASGFEWITNGDGDTIWKALYTRVESPLPDQPSTYLSWYGNSVNEYYYANRFIENIVQIEMGNFGATWSAIYTGFNNASHFLSVYGRDGTNPIFKTKSELLDLGLIEEVDGNFPSPPITTCDPALIIKDDHGVHVDAFTSFNSKCLEKGLGHTYDHDYDAVVMNSVFVRQNLPFQSHVVKEQMIVTQKSYRDFKFEFESYVNSSLQMSGTPTVLYGSDGSSPACKSHGFLFHNERFSTDFPAGSTVYGMPSTGSFLQDGWHKFTIIRREQHVVHFVDDVEVLNQMLSPFGAFGIKNDTVACQLAIRQVFNRASTEKGIMIRNVRISPPPPYPPPSPPTPPPPPGNPSPPPIPPSNPAFLLMEGSCSVSNTGLCITDGSLASENYKNNEVCAFAVLRDVFVSTIRFDVEEHGPQYWDYLSIGNLTVCNTMISPNCYAGTIGPRTQLITGDIIRWFTDEVVEKSGFEICAHDTAPPSTPPLPPPPPTPPSSPPPSPNLPPASGCVDTPATCTWMNAFEGNIAWIGTSCGVVPSTTVAPGGLACFVSGLQNFGVTFNGDTTNCVEVAQETTAAFGWSAIPVDLITPAIICPPTCVSTPASCTWMNTFEGNVAWIGTSCGVAPSTTVVPDDLACFVSGLQNFGFTFNGDTTNCVEVTQEVTAAFGWSAIPVDLITPATVCP